MASFDGEQHSCSTQVAAPSSATNVLSRSELQDLKDAFVLFDTESRGEISVRELRSVLQELQQHEGRSNSSSSLQRLLSALDSLSSWSANKDRMLSLDDFVSLLTTPNPNDTRDDVEQVFDLFDVEGKGYISVQDLRAVAADLGENGSSSCMMLSDADLQEMLSNYSGRVTIDQFRDIMSKKLFS